MRMHTPTPTHSDRSKVCMCACANNTNDRESNERENAITFLSTNTTISGWSSPHPICPHTMHLLPSKAQFQVHVWHPLRTSLPWTPFRHRDVCVRTARSFFSPVCEAPGFTRSRRKLRTAKGNTVKISTAKNSHMNGLAKVDRVRRALLGNDRTDYGFLTSTRLVLLHLLTHGKVKNPFAVVRSSSLQSSLFHPVGRTGLLHRVTPLRMSGRFLGLLADSNTQPFFLPTQFPRLSLHNTPLLECVHIGAP